MRHNFKKVVSTGCLFLCLGGWVYSDRAVLGDEATQARENLLNAAVQGAPVIMAQATTSAPAGNTGGASLAEPKVATGPGDFVESMSFSDTDITLALHFLAEKLHKNIIASRDVKGTVTVNLYNMPFDKALEAILRTNNYKYISEDNG